MTAALIAVSALAAMLALALIADRLGSRPKRFLTAIGIGAVVGLAAVGVLALTLAGTGSLILVEPNAVPTADTSPTPIPRHGSADVDGRVGSSAAGHHYCTPEKREAIAALELSAARTVDEPALLRRATDRFLREAHDAPRPSACVDNDAQFLLDVSDGSRGEAGFGDAAKQVERLRNFERR
jgi:hypothetical protein